MSFTNRGPKGRGVWRAVPFIKNDALENCLIKSLRSENPGKTINKNFGVKAKKKPCLIFMYAKVCLEI